MKEEQSWEEKNLTEQEKSCSNNIVQDNINTISKIETDSIQNVSNDILGKRIWMRNCPNCNVVIKYNYKHHLIRAIKNNLYCRKCGGIKISKKLKKIKTIDEIELRKRRERERGRKKSARVYKEGKSWNQLHPYERKKYHANWYRENKEVLSKNSKNRYQNKKTEILQNRKEYYSKNKSIVRQRRKRWYYGNRINVLEKCKEYRNRPDIRRQRNEHRRNRKKIDVHYKLSVNLRGRLRIALKNNQKVGSAVRDLGCSIEEFKKYIESKFQEGMTWDNYGLYGWHIDHIKPLNSFDLTDRKQFLEACHYTNLQPLWAKDNYIKGCRLVFLTKIS